MSQETPKVSSNDEHTNRTEVFYESPRFEENVRGVGGCVRTWVPFYSRYVGTNYSIWPRLTLPLSSPEDKKSFLDYTSGFHSPLWPSGRGNIHTVPRRRSRRHFYWIGLTRRGVSVRDRLLSYLGEVTWFLWPWGTVSGLRFSKFLDSDSDLFMVFEDWNPLLRSLNSHKDRDKSHCTTYLLVRVLVWLFVYKRWINTKKIFFSTDLYVLKIIYLYNAKWIPGDNNRTFVSN